MKKIIEQYKLFALAALAVVGVTACDGNSDEPDVAGKTPVGIGEIRVSVKESTRAGEVFDRQTLTVTATHKSGGSEKTAIFNRQESDGTYKANPGHLLYVEDILPVDEFDYTMSNGTPEEVYDQSDDAKFTDADRLEGDATLTGSELSCTTMKHQKILYTVIIEKAMTSSETFKALTERELEFKTNDSQTIKAKPMTTETGDVWYSACITPDHATVSGEGSFILVADNKANIEGSFKLPDSKALIAGESVTITVTPNYDNTLAITTTLDTSWERQPGVDKTIPVDVNK